MANTYSTDLELSSSQYWNIADGSQTGLDLGGDFTLEVWVKFESITASENCFIGKFLSAGNQRSYAFTYNASNNNKLVLDTYTDGSTNFRNFSDALTVNTGTWYHFAVAYDISAGQAWFYQDGIAKGGDSNGATSLHDGTAAFTVGAVSNPIWFTDGLIDEARVWNDIRTSQEIVDNKNTELNGNETGLVAYYKFNNDGTDSQTAGNNDLTGVNSPTFSSDVPNWATAYDLICSAGSFVLSGIAVTLKSARKLAIAVGSFVLTGVAVTLLKGKKLICDTGTYTLTGINTTITSARNMAITAGTFVLTGVAVILNRGYCLIISIGSYILTGVDVILKSSTWNKRTKPTTTWTDRTPPTTNWTKRT